MGVFVGQGLQRFALVILKMSVTVIVTAEPLVAVGIRPILLHSFIFSIKVVRVFYIM